MKTTNPTSVFLKAVTAAALVSITGSLHASLLVYEGFNYGGSGIANLNGTASTATGVSGNWAVSNTGVASSAYQTSGLSFGSNFATSSGGALLSSSKYSGSNGQSTASIKLNITATGTVWNSYLVNYTNLDDTNNGHALQGIGPDAAGTTTTFASVAFTNTDGASSRTFGSKYDTTTTASSAANIATGTTYLFVSRFTNVGSALSAGSPGVATTWVFTQAGYDLWVNSGALEANLAVNAFKTFSDSASTGTFNINTNSYALFRTDAPDDNSKSQAVAVFDELRYGTTLADVTTGVSAVPEPSTYALLAGVVGLAGAVAARRRRA